MLCVFVVCACVCAVMCTRACVHVCMIYGYVLGSRWDERENVGGEKYLNVKKNIRTVEATTQ